MPKYPAHYIRDDTDDLELAYVTPALPEDVEALKAANVDSEGRSEWVWLRLRDGTLILGIFPCGDTYMQYSDAGVCDFGEPQDA